MNHAAHEEKFEIPAKYLAALSRYKWIMGLTICILAGVVGAVSYYVPSTYRSEGLVLVETQQIPDDLIQSTVTSAAAERIQIIRQRVMTRDRMLNLMDKYPALRDSMQDDLVSQQVEALRERVTIETIRANNNRRGAAIAFRVGFDARDPEIARSVANDLITLFLDENVRARTERASETTGFLEGEAEKMRRRLDQTENAIADFKSENKDALPEHLNLYLSQLERARSQEIEIRRQLEFENAQISLFENDLANIEPEEFDNPEYQRLEAELARLTALFKDSHPDVRAVRQQLASAEGFQKTSRKNLAETVIEGKIQASTQQVKLLKDELDVLQGNITALETRVVRIPQVEQGLISLNRDYEAVKRKYDQLVGNTMQAELAESLEQGRKAERFSLLEAPILPDQPHSPDRKKLLGGGLAAAAGLPMALVLAVGFFDNSVRGKSGVVRVLGQSPLVAVGQINPGRGRRNGWVTALIVLLSLVLLALVGAGIVHTQYMPLDGYLYQAIYKFNLEGLIP